MATHIDETLPALVERVRHLLAERMGRARRGRDQFPVELGNTLGSGLPVKAQMRDQSEAGTLADEGAVTRRPFWTPLRVRAAGEMLRCQALAMSLGQ